MFSFLLPREQLPRRLLTLLAVVLTVPVAGAVIALMPPILTIAGITVVLVSTTIVRRADRIILAILALFIFFPVAGIFVPAITSLEYTLYKEVWYFFVLGMLLVFHKKPQERTLEARKWSAFDVLILAYLLVLIVYFAFTSRNYLIGLASLRAHIAFLPLALLIPRRVNLSSARKILVGVFWMVVLLAALHSWYFVFVLDLVFARGPSRYFFGVVNPNIVGTIYAIQLVLILNLTDRVTGFRNKSLGRVVALTASVILLFALMISLSRRSIIALIVALTVGFFLFNRQVSRAKRVLIIIVVWLLLFGAYQFGPDALQSRIESVFLTNLSDEWVRIGELNKVWSIYASTPLRFLTGQGFGAVSADSLLHQDTDVTYYHNYYLQLLSDSGILGVGLFLLIAGAIASTPLLRGDWERQAYHSALSQAVIVVLISNAFGTTLGSIPVNTLFWCLIGLSLVGIRRGMSVTGR